MRRGRGADGLYGQECREDVVTGPGNLNTTSLVIAHPRHSAPLRCHLASTVILVPFAPFPRRSVQSATLLAGAPATGSAVVNP